MITEIVLGAATLGQLGLLSWLVVGRVRAADAVADARVAQSDTEAHLERAQFELEQTKQALEATTKRADALEGVLADEINAAPDPTLGRADVRSRLLRFAQATRPGDPGGADHAPDLHPPAAAPSSRAAELPAGSATVR